MWIVNHNVRSLATNHHPVTYCPLFLIEQEEAVGTICEVGDNILPQQVDAEKVK